MVSCNINFNCTLKNDIALTASASCNIIFQSAIKLILHSPKCHICILSCNISFCRSINIYYLSFRFWIGIWNAVILLLMVAFDLSFLVQYITRFTEEVFIAIIAVIFTIESIEKLAGTKDEVAKAYAITNTTDCLCLEKFNYSILARENVWRPYDLTTSCTIFNTTIPDCSSRGGQLFGSECPPSWKADPAFLMSILLFLGTFFVALGIRLFKRTSFLTTGVRSYMSISLS